MRRSKSRRSSLDMPAINSFDFSSQRLMVYTDRQAPIPLLITAPLSSWARNFAGTAILPFASMLCSYSPRNIKNRYTLSNDESALFLQRLPSQKLAADRKDSPLYPTDRKNA